MNQGLGAAIGAVAVAILVVTSVLALPLLGVSVGPFDDGGSQSVQQEDGETESTGNATDGGESLGLVSMDPTTDAEGTEADASGADAEDGTDATASLAQEQVDAVEAGVDEGIELVQSQGVEVTQEQREAAVEGARESFARHQGADTEQVQAATAGAVHGSLMQEQSVEAEQVQYAVSGATDGALAQHQSVEASQLQSAAWGATHGTMAQSQRVEVEQLQVAARGAAAGAAHEAGESGVDSKPKIQEAAQGASYGVLEQYQTITVEQRQRVTLEHVQNAAAGASSGALEGSSEAAVDQEQRVEVEQYQRIDIKQVQKAAIGAAKGALVQRQEVTVEQTQAAAHGAGKGSLKQLQTVSVEQVQRVSITQIQAASFGAAKGAIYQSQSATVEQIQAAADGAAGGVLVQQQEISITQIQSAAFGASQGAIEAVVQYQEITITQIQSAAFGAGEGAVLQKQIVDVTQIQVLASGSASGALSQYQSATAEQIQFTARSACQETAQAVQYQRISITQLQILVQETASEATAYVAQEGIDDESDLEQYLEDDVEQRLDDVEEREGEASITFDDQESDGESVVVDEVELSDGGFVAIYPSDAVADPAAVLGASDSLEAGEQGDVGIDLEEPIESDRSLVAVVHHDTTGDGTFQYAESDGAEDDPYVSPSGSPVLDTALVMVGDGDGDAPEAPLDTDPGDSNETDIEEPNGTDPGEPNETDPNETDLNETGPSEPNATLSVSDQTGDGESLVVGEASATVEYVLSAAYDGNRVDSDSFEANETVSNETLDLEPPLSENATVDVSIRAADDDTELANDSIEYALEDEENESEPSATLEVADQTGDGENLTVESANASVEYGLTVTDADGEQRAASDSFAAGEALSNETLTLEPPLEENATLDVSVVDGDGTELANDSLEYTLADEENGSGAPTGFEAEFVDCSRAEVTGSFEEGDTIVVATGFYESSGFGNSMGEYAITVGDHVDAPFEGTATFETGEEFTVTETADGANVTVPEGEFGAAITGFASPEAIAGDIDHPNPQARECLDEVRPERPNISVENATPTEDGIAVTFGYDNPNEAPLFADSEFVEGTTDDVPVEELEPGANSFTVEWTPESDDERLVWEVGLSNYDYEETLTAETPPAGEIQSAEPANQTVGNEGAPEESETTATQEPAGDEPAEPEEPANSTDPATGESANSTEPAAPTAPAEPTDPAEPAESTEPSEPAESDPSGEAQEPAETQGTPEESNESEAAAEPEAPAEPDAPVPETESGGNASAA